MQFAIIDLERASDRMHRNVVWWALMKLGKEEWLIKIVQLMYRNVPSPAQVKGTFSDDFLVQVVLNQAPVLSPLLFIIGLEALFREIRSGCPEELLYAHD